MSVINQMLRDLEQRQGGGESAVYVAPVHRQGWWMLALTLLCGLAIGILGWRTWIYSQQSPRVQVPTAMTEVSQSSGAVSHTKSAPSSVAAPAVMPVSAALALSTPEAATVADTHAAETSEPEALEALPAADDESLTPQGEPEEMADDEVVPSDEELQPDLQAELAAEQEAIAAAPPRKPGVLKIETVDLSEPELAALAERKASTAMAKGQMREAQDNYYQVLAHDPHNQGAREQLAGLLYGEGRLTEAGQVLEEGLRLAPQQADFRLLLARVAIGEGDRQKALGWLTGYQPELASNMDYYATWAGLTQELGQNAQAAELYVKLLRQQPDQGRWWLGLGVAEDGQGHSQRALDAYRNAQLHGNLGAASSSWLEQRIAQLAPSS
ncbi:tetratricopeptide repeat protein [Aeromonas eucrenophila]|uniref:Tetratricopeptide repeat protein n=1 Tax=Aeromonas eucrenophila TaxID=649 RepID=A0ABW0YBS9_9GAMM|nr:tetratricopeptide repeat protein [Aeromonas eucrenophila]